MIHRRGRVGIIDFNDAEEFKDETISGYFCPHCKEYGFEVPLRNRIYPEGELVPSDHDQWKMCFDCGLILAIHELEKQASVTDAVDTVESPFDLGKSFLGVDKRHLSKKKMQRKDILAEYEYINDEELKQELKKGSTLLSYSEQLP